MNTKWPKACIPLFLMMGCVAAPEHDDEEVLGEAVLAYTIDAPMISVGETPTDRNQWPKTVKWCVNAGHETHGPFYWKVSWSGTIQQTSTNCISYPSSISAELCGLWAMVDHDSWGHTGDLLNPKRYSVFDHRNPIAITPASYSRTVGQSVTLQAPAPHCTRHCDGLGTTIWEVKNALGQWVPITSTQNQCTWTVSSPSAGTETYHLKSSHNGFDSFSNDIVVTWSNGPAQCQASVTCPDGSTQSCTGTGGTCSSTQYSVICDGFPYLCSCAAPCSKSTQCDPYCGGTNLGYCVPKLFECGYTCDCKQ